MNKTAVVIGATSEIGIEICKKLSEDYSLRAGYRSQEKFEKMLPIWLKLVSSQIDITDEKSVKEFFKVWEIPAVLINNAAININSICEKTELEDFELVMKTNVTGAFLTMKEVIPRMKLNSWGRIINISSIVSDTGAYGASAYAASKAALNSLTKSVAKEVGKYGITVNSIILGYMDTGLIRDVPDNIVDNIKKSTPVKRLGTAKDIASLISYLCSEEASFITGSLISLTGGYST